MRGFGMEWPDPPGRCDVDTSKAKVDQLHEYLNQFRKVAVAFSGGKDSFFVLKSAVGVLGKDRVLALWVSHPFSSKTDLKRMGYFRKQLDFRFRTVNVDFSGIPGVWSNPRDRCYHCKKTMFQTIRSEAEKEGIQVVLDGTSYSDLSEYRPGLAALEELGVKSPLKEMSIVSPEIEQWLAQSGIEPVFLSPSTCLATRFPYGYSLSRTELKRVDDLESFFIDEGIFPIRVRVIPDGIRIETPVRHFDRIKRIRERIVSFCHDRGIKWITLDLEGIKTGTWD